MSESAALRVRLDSPEYGRLAQRARRLSWLTLAILGVEGTDAILTGVLAGSIALIGFGIDSGIEALASIIIVWRFTGGRTLSEDAERRGQKLVALSFFILAPYIAVEATQALIGGDRPETSSRGARAVGACWPDSPVFG
jgi:hypothetical protein